MPATARFPVRPCCLRSGTLMRASACIRMLLRLVAWLVGGITITGFWAAFWGALVISLVSWFLSLMFDSRLKVSVIRRGGRR